MAKCTIDSLTPNQKETQQIKKSHVRKNFKTIQTTTLQTTMDTFHDNFIANLRAHPLLHRGVNLGVRLDS
jgi:hypothetical protein